MTGDDTAVTPAVWKTSANGETLEQLHLTLPPGFPLARLGLAWVRYRGDFYPLRPENGGLASFGAASKPDEFFSSQTLMNSMNYYAYNNRREMSVDTVFNNSQRVLMANSLGGNEHLPHYISRAPQPADQAEVFLFVNGSPEAFRLSGAGNGSEPSMVMYQRTVFKPQAP